MSNLTSDFLAIQDVLHRYASALDGKNWPDLRTVFTAEVRADFRSFGVKQVFTGPAGEWIARLEGTLSGMDATQHLMGNHHYTLAGERATGTTYLQATHVCANEAGGDHYVVGGHYEVDLHKAGEAWWIAAYTLVVSWQAGDRGVLRAARRRREGASPPSG